VRGEGRGRIGAPPASAPSIFLYARRGGEKRGKGEIERGSRICRGGGGGGRCPSQLAPEKRTERDLGEQKAALTPFSRRRKRGGPSHLSRPGGRQQASSAKPAEKKRESSRALQNSALILFVLASEEREKKREGENGGPICRVGDSTEVSRVEGGSGPARMTRNRSSHCRKREKEERKHLSKGRKRGYFFNRREESVPGFLKGLWGGGGGGGGGGGKKSAMEENDCIKRSTSSGKERPGEASISTNSSARKGRRREGGERARHPFFVHYRRRGVLLFPSLRRRGEGELRAQRDDNLYIFEFHGKREKKREERCAHGLAFSWAPESIVAS